MVRIKDIVVAVRNKIEKIDPKAVVYAKEVEERFSIPCYFINVLPVERQLEKANKYKVDLTVTINYFSDTNRYADNYEILDDLFLELNGVLEVSGRKLTINGFRFETVEKGVFNISFSLTFRDQIEQEDEGIVAREVYTNLVKE